MIKKLLLIITLFVFYVPIFCMEESADEGANNEIKLILLHGASCAGKTSMANEPLAQYNSINTSKPAVHISFDDYYAEAAKNLDYLEILKEKVRRKKGIKYNQKDEFYALFHHQILEQLEKGNIIIVDHCFLTKEAFPNFLYIFKNYYHSIAFVKVFCSYETAKKRLQERNNSADVRQHRSGEMNLRNHYVTHYNTIYGNKEYDESVDTSDCSPTEAAQKVMSMLHQKKEAMQKNYKFYRTTLQSMYPPEF